MDALVPLEYTDLKIKAAPGPFHDQTFGIGDVFFEGTWSWAPETV